MTPLPTSKSPKSEVAVYIWAVVIMTLIGSVLVVGILYIRPLSDPLDVLANVLKGLAPTIAGVLAFLKSQETHLSVNSRLDAFMAEHAQNARTAGVAEGVAQEQARLISSATKPAPVPVPVPSVLKQP